MRWGPLVAIGAAEKPSASLESRIRPGRNGSGTWWSISAPFADRKFPILDITNIAMAMLPVGIFGARIRRTVWCPAGSEDKWLQNRYQSLAWD
jgi:hypothetical protein